MDLGYDYTTVSDPRPGVAGPRHEGHSFETVYGRNTEGEVNNFQGPRYE